MALLDRDGVLNVDVGYVCTPERFTWVEGALDAVKFLNSRGYSVAIVTNQSGIGRGMFSEEQYVEFATWIERQVAESGGRIEKTYYCPHLPIDECECRKPKPGMILAALEETGSDPAQSFLIGDSERDLQAAQSAGVAAYRFEGGNLREFAESVVTRESEIQNVKQG